MITVDLRQLVLVLDDEHNHRDGHGGRNGLHLDATDVQHSAGKRATARVRSCRRRPCPRRGWPSSYIFPLVRSLTVKAGVAKGIG